MKKYITKGLTVLGVVLVLATLLTVGAMATENTAPELDIYAANLSFEDAVYLMYAVDAENVSADQVTMLFWTAPILQSAPEAYVKGTEDYVGTNCGDVTIKGGTYKMFKYDKLHAKNMTDVIYARAYVEVDGVAYYSELSKYSILQYAYNKLGYTGTATDSAALQTMLRDMLTYGASAQNYFTYNTDRLATDSFYEINLVGGVMADGATHGLYLEGEQPTIKAPATDAEGNAFSAWLNSAGSAVASSATYALTVGTTNETYTASYGAKYSTGLEFDSNGDGTCCLLGMGDCTDTDLIIPPTSPDGDIVTEIDRSAFAGEALTSVSFPATITSIGNKAFNNCTALTDVYFDGTEEEWGAIDIGTYNDPLENATKHFKEVVTEDFTEPTLCVQNVQVDKSNAEVTFDLYIGCNPGVMNMLVSMTVNDEIFSFQSATKGGALTSLTLTTPGEQITESPYRFLLDGQDVTEQDAVDGVVFTVTLGIKDAAAVGTYAIEFSYVEGDIVDGDMQPVDFQIVNGTIAME